MPKDHFSQRKKDTLLKKDRSSKQRWDKQISSLCEKINSHLDFYTTSSCSGRILIMADQNKKGPGLFKFVSHDLINLNSLKNYLAKENSGLNLKFKQEPCILHVACRTLEDAKNLLKKAQTAGWKRYGIIASGKRFVVELNGTDKLEFPITKKGKLLVGEEFLEEVVRKSNSNLKKSWEIIERLEKVV